MNQSEGFGHLILLSNWWVGIYFSVTSGRARKRLRLRIVRGQGQGAKGLKSGAGTPSFSVLRHWGVADLCQTAVSLHEAPGNREGVDNNSM